MRIVFLSHYSLPHVGGIETAIAGVAEELGRRGHDVAHVSSDAGDASDSDRPSPYRVVRLPALNVLEHRLSVPYPLFDVRLPRALRREVLAADVVHAHGFLYMPSLFGLPLARRSRARPVTVLTEHVGHVAYESSLLNGLESLAIATIGRVSLRAADAIVINNERVEAEIHRLVPDRRLDFLPNGVDTERFRPPSPKERADLRGELGWTDNKPRVLFVGRPVPKKGIDLALSAAELANGTFNLVLVGPKELSRPAGQGVELLGPQPHERLKLLYRAADALLLPSRGEGFPVTVQEAMASGLPVVLCDDPSYRPHLEGAAEGARLTAADGRAIVDALGSFVGDRHKQQVAARAAEAHAKRAFSTSKVADDHLALYARVRAERGT